MRRNSLMCITLLGWGLSFFLLLSFHPPANAQERKLKVVTTLEDLRFIAMEVGGERVEVSALAKGYQDPHYVAPKPSDMAVVNEADLFVEIGLNLEIWTERVLDGARNPRVRVSQPGHVFAYEGVPRLEVPEVITRAAGDLHPYGNPHIWLDPLNAKVIAQNIMEGLKRVSPRDADYFQKRKEAFDLKIDQALFGPELVNLFGGDLLSRLLKKGELFRFLETKEVRSKRLIDLLGGWLKEAEPLRGGKIIFFHQSWIYFAERFGLNIRNYVEEKPGISPSAKHKEELIRQVKEEGIKVIGVGSYYDDTIPLSIARETGVKVVILPISTGGVKGVDDYFSLFDYLIKTLSAAYEG